MGCFQLAGVIVVIKKKDLIDTKIAINLIFLSELVVANSFSQSIYLNFDPTSDEKCHVSSSPTKKEPSLKFSKREQNGNLHFRICFEEFVYTQGHIFEIRKRDELKISSLKDLYAFENEGFSGHANNDSVVYIRFKNEIDSVFIAERIDDQFTKVYAVKWVEQIE